MRKCVRCETEMVENCGIRIERHGYGIIIADSPGAFSVRIEKPKVAVCPNCGEISLYVENVNMLKR
ncbi:MAG: nucleic acid-binding protein [Oscillospiraceae bacterium]|nr:nucleic acid-binding protein [Oscillospiraceae bacterium]